MYIDLAYLHATVRDRGQEAFFDSRHSHGYFGKVWGVHPVADVGGKKSSQIETSRFSDDQVIIEGPAFAHGWPSVLRLPDFLVSQSKLISYLVRTIRENNISVIFAMDPFYGGLLGLILSKICRRPVVVSVYGNFDLAYETDKTLAMPGFLPTKWLQDKVAKFVFSRADLVFSGNRNNVGYALDHGADPSKTVLLPAAKFIQACHFSEPSERADGDDVFQSLGLPAGRQYLLSVARLLKIKLVEDALQAMMIAVKRNPAVVGVFAGDGPLREQLEATVAAEGLTERIFFLGNVSQESLSKLYPHSITLSPLTGLSLMEAGLGGSPTVAYDLEWQSEFIQDGVNGYLVPSRDVGAMADKALAILGDDELRKRFAMTIRQSAVAFADPVKLAANEKAAFDNVLKRNAAHALSA
jgi:glycosyltransferase involved in cell wall biosynthesis